MPSCFVPGCRSGYDDCKEVSGSFLSEESESGDFILLKNQIYCFYQMSSSFAKELKRLPKPKLRGHCTASFHFHIGMACLLGITSAALFKIFWCDASERHYKEFYEHYNAEEDAKRMAACGVFTSVPVSKN